MSLRSIDELKDEITIEEVLVAAGAEFDLSRGWNDEQPFYCPFHPNVNTPAASMNLMKGVFNCYACDASGSIIDAAMLYLDTKSIQEAKDWLDETFLG